MEKLSKRQKFELETKQQKIKKTKGCLSYNLSHTRGSVYLCVTMPNSIQIFKWAPQPFYRFMDVKELPIVGATSVDVVEVMEHGRLTAKVFIGHEGRFKILDVEEVQVDLLGLPQGIDESRTGRAVRGITVGNLSGLDGSFVLCHQNLGVIASLDRIEDTKHNKTLTWRHPLTFVSTIGEQFLVAGSAGIVDVIQVSTGKVVHGGLQRSLGVFGNTNLSFRLSVFETRKDKAKELSVLFQRGNTLYLLVDESKDGKDNASVITIAQEWAPNTPTS